MKPAECAEGRGDDCSQAERTWLSILPQENCDAVLNLLQLLLTRCYCGALSLQPFCLVHHALVGVSHLVLQTQFHTGKKLAGGSRRLWSKQQLISGKRDTHTFSWYRELHHEEQNISLDVIHGDAATCPVS